MRERGRERERESGRKKRERERVRETETDIGPLMTLRVCITGRGVHSLFSPFYEYARSPKPRAKAALEISF